jgi:serine/threonine protein kinase
MDGAPDITGYTLKKKIGQGGMATVYLAIQRSLDRDVALKIMNPGLVAESSFCERFLKEGRIIAKLGDHPSIVTIYDIGCSKPHYFMAMEYIGGGTLKQHLGREGGIDRALAIIRQVASALAYAHKQGFVHRDVKPANILFGEDGTAILTDFGIAKAVGGQTQLTRVGFTVGTAEYMSPEQAVGVEMDGRSDLYSLGVVLYELLTGRKPYVGDNALAIALLHQQSPVPLLPEPLRPLQPLIARLLAKQPEDRFSNAEELIANIDGICTEGLTAPKRGLLALSPRSKRTAKGRNRVVVDSMPLWKWALGLGFAAAVISGTAVFYLSAETRRVNMPEAPAPQEPNPAASTLGPAERDRIAHLLEVAEAHAAVGRLTDPPGANAYEAYQLILEINPNNVEATRGLHDIEQRRRD